MTHARIVGPLALFAMGASGCEAGTTATPEGFLLGDSAGVEIARNLQAKELIPRVHLGGDPLLRLGGDEEGQPDFFSQINSVHLDPRGNLWVADLLTSELRVFSIPAGEHLFTVGRRGEGPGEFMLPAPVGFDADGAWVWDQQLGRLTRFRLDGQFIDVQRVVHRGEVVPRLLLRTGDGAFLGRLPEAYPGPASDGMLLQDTVRVWRFEDFETDPSLVAQREGSTWVYAHGMQVPVPFTADSHLAVKGNLVVFTAPSGDPVLEVVEEGSLRRRIEVERARIPVTREAVDGVLGGPRLSEQMAEVIRERSAELPVPDLVPTWEWLRISPTGHIFALHHGTLLSGEAWDVFDPDGRLIALVTLDDQAHLMEVGDEHVVVMEMPEFRGPGVSVYPFQVPQEAPRD
jgi:hypothetical protein